MTLELKRSLENLCNAIQLQTETLGRLPPGYEVNILGQQDISIMRVATDSVKDALAKEPVDAGGNMPSGNALPHTLTIPSGFPFQQIS
jgi:hypothetical protein